MIQKGKSGSPRSSRGYSNLAGQSAAMCGLTNAWAKASAEVMRRQVAELAALAPDVILTTGSQATELMVQATRTVPIVFAIVADPVGAGIVARLSRPGGNATGFMQFEYSLSGKWLELLKQIAPGVNRAAVLRDPTSTAGIGQFAVIQSVAPSVGVEVSPINTNDAAIEIERAVSDFAREPNGGLIATASASGITQRELIVSLANRYKLPAVYFNRDPFPSAV
jgi:putative ABC transport system substrate-binding protein